MRRITIAAASFAWLSFLLSTPVTADTTAAVATVIDGDTFKLESGEKVRLIGIDTPETVHPRKPVEYFGPEAKAHLESLILDRTVTLVSGHEERDKYNRLLAYVYLDTLNINLKMVADGYAMAYLKYPCEMEDEFLQAELAARRAAVGMWASPTNPYMKAVALEPVTQPTVKAEPVKKPQKNYWINSNSMKRHNASCRWYGSTKKGYYTTKKEGSACGICGG